MTEKKPSIPIHPIVFSLKGKIDSLEKRLEYIEQNLKKLDIRIDGIPAFP